MDDNVGRKPKPKAPKKKAVKKAVGPRGFKRTKTQISVRLEDSVLALAQHITQIFGEGLTDIVETAVWADMVRRFKEPPKSHVARFLLLRATPAEQETVASILGFLRMPVEARGDEIDRLVAEAFWKVLAKAKEKPEFKEALASYGEMPPVIKTEVEDLRNFFIDLYRGPSPDVSNSSNEL